MNHFQPLGLRAQNCLRKTWKVCNFSLVWGERGSISDILNLSHCLHVMCLTFWGSNFWEECRAHGARSQADPYGHRRVHRAKPISLGPWPLSDISAIFAGLFVWSIPAPCLPPGNYLDFFWQRAFQPLMCHIGNLWNSDKKWGNNLEKEQNRKGGFKWVVQFQSKQIWKSFNDVMSFEIQNISSHKWLLTFGPSGRLNFVYVSMMHVCMMHACMMHACMMHVYMQAGKI